VKRSCNTVGRLRVRCEFKPFQGHICFLREKNTNKTRNANSSVLDDSIVNNDSFINEQMISVV